MAFKESVEFLPLLDTKFLYVKATYANELKS